MKALKTFLALGILSVGVLSIGCTQEKAENEVSKSFFEPETTSEAVSVTVENSDNYKILIAKGNECFQNGNIRLGSFYFANAITLAPGNMEVIDAYYFALTQAEQETDDLETKFGYLDALEVFLQNQAVYVPVEQVEPLVQKLDAVIVCRTELENGENTENGENLAEETVTEVENNTENNSEMDEETTEFMSAFSELNMILTEQMEYVNQTLKLAETDAHQLDIASYQLQNCEQTLREIITLQPHLGVAQKSEIAASYAKLQTLSETVVDVKAKKIWDEYLVLHEEYLAEMVKFPEYNTTPAMYEDGKPAFGVAEKKIVRIRKQMEKLQNILPKLSEKYLGNASENPSETATGKLKELQTALREESEKQQKHYNLWAIENIKTCLNKAREGVGVFANGEEGRTAIENALVTHLAPIDIRLLTHEVTQLYMEVEGKYLADNQLNPAKDEKSFNEKGNKLHTLNQMYNMPKVPLHRF